MRIEDGLAENDWDGWTGADRRSWATKVQLVGDDLFCTNTEILAKGIESDVANAILIKVNQIGTLTETLDGDGAGAQSAGYASIFASQRRDRRHVHRRSCGGHAGRPDQDRLGQSRTDRVAKYNQLLRIEEAAG